MIQIIDGWYFDDFETNLTSTYRVLLENNTPLYEHDHFFQIKIWLLSIIDILYCKEAQFKLKIAAVNISLK